MADSKEQILLELKIKTDLASAALEKTNVAIKKTIQSFKKLKEGSLDYQQAQAKLASLQANYAKQSLNYAKALQNQIGAGKTGLNGVTGATGGATAATLELGRVISDMPYGIRGVANNLSQFASQFSFMSNKVDETTGKVVGFNGAIKGLGKAIKANAILLAIQAIISAFDYFSGGAKKAEKSTEDLTKSLREQVEVLNSYKTALDESNLSLDEREGLIKAVTIKSKEFAKIIEESKGGLTSETEALNKFVAKKDKELEVKTKIANLDKANAVIREEEIKGLNKVNEEISLYEKIVSNTGLGNEAMLLRLEQLRKVKTAYEDQKIILSQLNKLIEDNPENSNKFKEGTVAWYKKQISDKEKIRDKTADNTKEYKNQTKEVTRLRNELKKLIGDAEDREKAKGLDKLKPVGIGETKKKMQEIFSIVSEGLGVDLKDSPLSIAPELNFDLSEGTKKGIDDYNKIVRKTITEKFNAEDIADSLDAFKEALSTISDFADAQFERELTTEQNKTTALNQELNNRLLNENLAKDERIKIQNEIAQNDEKLRVKQNAIKKKQFNTQKAFNLSMALVDTASSALKAYGSQLIIGDPTSIIRAKVAAGIATAVGLAQVATIASQKFQADSASTPIRTSSGGGAGGGVGDRSFDFNLVGATQGNQVLDAIQGQFNKPVQAYVVSRDMTNQQQLDANIKNQASF
jgi:hypothetical protein